MAYIGNIGDKINTEVTLVGIHEYMDYAFSYYGTTKYIYTMKDPEGNILVWKSTAYMCIKTEERNSITGDPYYYGIRKNDKIQITGTIKGHSTYKDEEQTVLQRVKVVKLIEKAVTWEEKKAAKQEEQLATLTGGDFVWTMPYKQYKAHYSDCETIYASYNDHADENRNDPVRFHPATISVIIREGRLKASGVRGEHFSGYQMENELGQKITYRAVNEDNALKRVQKDFPDHTWKCTKIYDYQDYHRIW